MRVLASPNAAIRLFLLLLILASPTARAATRASLPDSVLASVGNRTVTRSEFLRQWRRLSPPSEGKSMARRKREFLDELVNKEALSMAIAGGHFVPSAEDSARLVQQRTVMARQEYYRRMVLDSLPPPDTSSHAMHGGHAGHEGHGSDSDPTSAEREVERRLIERHVAPLSPTFDDSAAAVLARAFAKLPTPYEQGPGWVRYNYTTWMPPVAARDTARVLARSTLGTFTVGRFLWHWNLIPASQRDRPDRVETVIEWAKSFLAQASIDAEASRMGLDRLPEVETRLFQNRQVMALDAYYRKNILSQVDTSETRLRALWQKEPRHFDGPPSWLYYGLWYDSRDKAQRAYEALVSGVNWDSLVTARFPPAATEEEQRIVRSESDPYRVPQVLLEGGTDSTLQTWAFAARPGQTLGPRERAGQWWIYRFVEHRDGRHKSYDDARSNIVESVVREDGDVVLKRHFQELRRRYRVRINESALASLNPEAAE